MKRAEKDRLIIQSVVACMGTEGILCTLLSCGNLSVHNVIAYVAAAVFSMFFVILMNKRKQLKKCIAAAIGIVLALLLMFFKYIYNGFCFAANDIISVLETTGKMVPDRISVGDEIYSDKLKVWQEDIALLVFVMFTALLVCFVVVELKSVLCAIITILPIMLYFLSYNIVADIVSMFLCVLYVFAVASFKRNGMDTASPKRILLIGTVTALLCLAIVNPGTYKNFGIFNINFANVGYQIYDKYLRAMNISFLDTAFEGNKEGNDGIAIGDGSEKSDGKDVSFWSNGELGNKDEVNYENEDIFSVYTYDIGQTLYMPEQYGILYYYGENRWTQERFDNDEALKIEEKLISMIEYNKEMSDFIADGLGSYDELIKPYRYRKIQTVNGTLKETSVYDFVINENCYKKFAALADRERVIKTEEYWNAAGAYTTWSQEDYIYFEEKKRNTLANYRKISDEHRELIYSLVGENEVKTLDEKFEYIRLIKEFLVNNYSYTLSPGKLPEGKDFLEYFLSESKEGYCTYFATAATLMFRAAGIPARYVEGYAATSAHIRKSAYSLVDDIAYKNVAPEYKSNGKTVKEYFVNIKDSQAHAWVEVYIEGYGWVVVEVTPANMQTGTFGTGKNELAYEDETKSETPEELPQETESVVQTEAESQENETESSVQTVAVNKNKFKFTWWIFALILIIAFVVIIFVCGIKRYTRRKSRIEEILASGDVLKMYVCLEQLLKYTVYSRADMMSYEEYAEYLEQENYIFKENRFKDMVLIILKARFGGENVVISDAETQLVRECVSGIRNELTAQMPKFKYILIKYIYVV